MRIRKRVIEKDEYRTKTGFLFWPKTLDADQFSRPNEDRFQETRWLERATWRQRYGYDRDNRPNWCDLYWIDEEDENETPA